MKIIVLIIAFGFHILQAQIILGVHPLKTGTALYNQFTPLADYLSQKLQEDIHIQIAKDYQTHMTSVGEDRVDIAYLGPAVYVSLAWKYGDKRLLARQVVDGEPYLYGVYVTGTESSLKSIRDIAGKRMAFGNALSTMSHLVPRYEMAQLGLEGKYTFDFLNSHTNVALGVLMGNYDAGVLKAEVFEQYSSRGLKKLGMTRPYSEHLFIATKRLDSQKAERIKDIMLELGTSPKARELMAGFHPGISGLGDVKESDYDSVKEVLRWLKQEGIMP